MDVSEFFSLSSILFLVCRFTLRTHSEGSSPSLGTKSQTTRPKGCNVCSYNGSVGALVQSHALTGCDESLQLPDFTETGFNPRTLTGCDLSIVKLNIVILSFNPRTLTGCDIFPVGQAPCRCRFNPRTLTGCDTQNSIIISTLPMFQSTHPHGVRHHLLTISTILLTFQSTHPHGVRPDHLTIELIILLVSIHAPSRGATMGSYFFAERSIRFNPRTLTGCDQYRPPMS